MYGADYSIVAQTDMFVLIADDDVGSVSVTNDAESVVQRVNAEVGSLGSRHLYYVDSSGEIDELVHVGGDFKGFKPCSDKQRERLAQLAGTRGASCS
ncbi:MULTISPECIES: hypothetical protein [Halomonadaceae]|uniref:hypothetical protein n=1 Tax=Halomonadaceae TaxID=28256 RepID=UPI003CEC8A34